MSAGKTVAALINTDFEDAIEAVENTADSTLGRVLESMLGVDQMGGGLEGFAETLKICQRAKFECIKTLSMNDGEPPEGYSVEEAEGGMYKATDPDGEPLVEGMDFAFEQLALEDCWDDRMEGMYEF